MKIKEYLEQYIDDNLRDGKWLWFIFYAIIILMIIEVLV